MTALTVQLVRLYRQGARLLSPPLHAKHHHEFGRIAKRGYVPRVRVLSGDALAICVSLPSSASETSTIVSRWAGLRSHGAGYRM